MKNTLILGDCASDGSSTLVKEILGQNQVDLEYTLSWDSKHHKKIIIWYLEMTKGQRGTIQPNHLFLKAHEYMQEREMAEAWPKYLDPDLTITNTSKGGATAYGYYKRLLKYESQHGRPDLIVLTDYDTAHPWQRINLNGSKYFLEKNYDPRKPDFTVNPALKSPPEAQKLAFNKAKFTKKHELNQKRNFKIMHWFHKYLEKGKYNFIKLKFYEGFDQFDKDPNVIDCSDLRNKYEDIRNKYDILLHRGTNGVFKKQVQPEIGRRVQEKILLLTSKQFRV